MSALGFAIRANRLMSRRPGRLLDITVDHGIARGVLPGLEDIAALIEAIVATAPDAITLQKGIAEKCFPPYAGQVPLILKCSSYSPFHRDFDAMTASIEEAVALGADAAAMGVIIGGARQAEALTLLGGFTREARQCGLPTVAHIYPRGELIPGDEHYKTEQVRYAARVGAELGVDFIKTHYTGSAESFAEVVEASPALVLAAGGVSAEDGPAFLRQARAVMDAGAAGLACGRFVWTYPDMPALMRALKLIIHDDGSAEAAIELLGEEA